MRNAVCKWVKKNSILEEAKQKYLQMRKDYMDTQKTRVNNYIYSFNTILKEVEPIAVRHARKYFDSQQQQQQNQTQDDFEFIKIKEMFKIIIVPDKSLRHYFGCLSPEEAKKTFRMYALHIHPDKNNHPNAKIAFQKLFKSFMHEPTRVSNQSK